MSGSSTQIVFVPYLTIGIMIGIVVFSLCIYLIILAIKALKKYITSTPVREEKKMIQKSLSEILKENRIRCKMTQEFIAETIGVSRQAVSKWENGTSDPSTANLLALAKLYGISAEELLKGVTSKISENSEIKKE